MLLLLPAQTSADSTPGSATTVFALDAKSGKALRSYTYPLPASALPEACCNSDNRGVTLTNDEVVFGTLDAHLVALDAKTGKALWNVKVAHNPNGYAITSRGEYPTRGFIGIRLRNRQTALETVHDSGS